MEIRDIRDTASFTDDKASKVALAAGDHCRVTLWCLEAGQEIRPHAHAGDHVWVIQEGEGSLLTGEGEHRVAPGAVSFVPAGEVHGMRAKTRLVFTSVSAG